MRVLTCLLSFALLARTVTALAPALEPAEGAKPHKKKLTPMQEAEADFKKDRAKKWAEWGKSLGLPEATKKDGPDVGEKLLETLSGMKPVKGPAVPKAPQQGGGAAPPAPDPASSIEKAMEQMKKIGELFRPPASP